MSSHSSTRYTVSEASRTRKRLKMKAQQLLKIFALVMMISGCRGYIGGNQISVQDIQPQVYCGRDLSRAINLLCFGFPINNKRAMDNPVYDTIMPQYFKDKEAQWEELWIPHHRAKTLSLPSRDKRLIVTECCEKPCSVNELLSYC